MEVYKRSSASWLEDQDFFRFSGIFREVYLYAVPETHVRDLFVRADLENGYRDGKLKVEFKLQGTLKDRWLDAVLKDREGAEVCKFDAAPCDHMMVLEAEVPNVHSWSGEDPYLYELVVAVKKAGTGNGEFTDGRGSAGAAEEIVEVVPQQVGFRRFEMIDRVMCLNGKRLYSTASTVMNSMYAGGAPLRRRTCSGISGS